MQFFMVKRIAITAPVPGKRFDFVQSPLFLKKKKDKSSKLFGSFSLRKDFLFFFFF